MAGIHAGGNTNLHGGWREGAATLEDLSGAGLRVILLSDGQANEGLTDEEEIAVQCVQWAAEGVTTSTYGLGSRFNEELMVAIARAGGGNHYYGDTADDLMEPFQQELELLGNLCLRDLRLGVSVPDGVALTMLNDLPTVEGELARMRKAAGQGDWDLVDTLLDQASRQFAGHAWVAAMLAAMKSLAEGRERERVMKEAMYSSGKLNARLAEKDEVAYSLETRVVPAFLRRKPAQGKGNA